MRGAGSDVGLLLGEVDLVTEAQGHPLWNEGGRTYRYRRYCIVTYSLLQVPSKANMKQAISSAHLIHTSFFQ